MNYFEKGFPLKKYRMDNFLPQTISIWERSNAWTALKFLGVCVHLQMMRLEKRQVPTLTLLNVDRFDVRVKTLWNFFTVFSTIIHWIQLNLDLWHLLYLSFKKHLNLWLYLYYLVQKVLTLHLKKFNFLLNEMTKTHPLLYIRYCKTEKLIILKLSLLIWAAPVTQALITRMKMIIIQMHAFDWLKCSTQNTPTLIQPIEGMHLYRYRFRSRYRGLCDVALSLSVKSTVNLVNVFNHAKKTAHSLE